MKQISGWENMSPESQQRIMDAAKNAGYLATSKGSNFFMPNWMRGGKIGELEEQLGRRINPHTMSPEEWQKITPMASLKGDAYRQYQDFMALTRDEQARANQQRFSGGGALAKDPKSAPLPRPTPGNMPQQPNIPLGQIQPIPRPISLMNDVANRVPRPTPQTMPQAAMPLGAGVPGVPGMPITYAPKANFWTQPNAAASINPTMEAALKRGGLKLANALR